MYHKNAQITNKDAQITNKDDIYEEVIAKSRNVEFLGLGDDERD